MGLKWILEADNTHTERQYIGLSSTNVLLPRATVKGREEEAEKNTRKKGMRVMRRTSATIP